MEKANTREKNHKTHKPVKAQTKDHSGEEKSRKQKITSIEETTQKAQSLNQTLEDEAKTPDVQLT